MNPHEARIAANELRMQQPTGDKPPMAPMQPPVGAIPQNPAMPPQGMAPQAMPPKECRRRQCHSQECRQWAWTWHQVRRPWWLRSRLKAWPVKASHHKGTKQWQSGGRCGMRSSRNTKWSQLTSQQRLETEFHYTRLLTLSFRPLMVPLSQIGNSLGSITSETTWLTPANLAKNTGKIKRKKENDCITENILRQKNGKERLRSTKP